MVKHSAGDLYHRVAFDPPLVLDDGHGGVETGWDVDNAVTARAHFRFLRGSEPVIAARLQGVQPVVVTVRSSAAARAITPGWRLRDLNDGTMATGDDWQGPVYNIRSGPVPTDDRRFLEFTVERGVAV